MEITETLSSHIIAVYHAMEEDSVEENGTRFWRGSLTQLVRELGVSMTYYAAVFGVLYDNGFCALVDRGGRSKPSTIALLQEPTKSLLTPLTWEGPATRLSLVTRIEALESSTGGMYVVGALEEIEKRLKAIESKLKGKSNGKT